MTRLYLKGGNEADSPLKHVGDGSFSSGANHANTVVLLPCDDTNIYRGGNIGAIFSLQGDAAISSTGANIDKGFTNALQLDGTGDFLKFNPGVVTTVNRLYDAVGGASPIDCSIECYVRATSALTGANHALFGVEGYNYTWFGYRTTVGSISHYTGSGGWSNADHGIGSAEIGTNTWHHVRVVHDVSESSAYFFLDGALTATKTSVTGNMFYVGTGTGVYASVGFGSAFSSYWTGQICGFAIRAGIVASTASFEPPTLSQLLAGGWD